MREDSGPRKWYPLAPVGKLHEAARDVRSGVVAEPRNPTQTKLRDWPMFQLSPGKRKHRSNTLVFDGRPVPKISELLMSHVQGTPTEKLEWLRKQKAAGKLDGDDPDEIAEAEAMLAMLARISGSKVRKQSKHIDDLLDDALKGTFPASDPVSVGRFTGTEPAGQPIDREAVDPSSVGKTKGTVREKVRVRRHG